MKNKFLVAGILFMVMVSLMGCGGEQNYTVTEEKTVTFGEGGTKVKESTSHSFGD